MVTEELLKYIESERASGKDDLRIKNTLIAEGWTDSDLDEAFGKLKIPINSYNQNKTGYSFNFKKVFLVSFILSLILSSLIAIFIFLFGNFGLTEFRLLFTTFAIGGYSLVGLCHSVLFNKNKYIIFSIFGLIISLASFFVTVGVIWELIKFVDIWRIMLILMVLTFSLAHISLLFIVDLSKILVKITLIMTILFISMIAFMFIYLILDGDTNEFFYRLLGVFATLDVLGTILTPVLRKV